MGKVFSIIRKTFDRKPTDDLMDLDVNTATWRRSMFVTLQAAVHLGQDYSQNLRSITNQPLEYVKQLFRTTEKLIKDQVEITSLSTIDWSQPMWRQSSLLCDRAVRTMKSQTYVSADSVPSLEIQNYMVFGDTPFQRFGSNRRGADGIRVDKFSEDSLHWEFSTRFKRWWRYQGVSSSCQCTMTLSGEHRKMKKIVWRITCTLRHMPRSSRTNVGQFWDLVVRKSGMELMSVSQMVNGTKLQKSWCSPLLRAGNLYFVPPVLWTEENLKAKEVERNPFTSTEVKKPLICFAALLFLSISSVSTEQSQICAKNWMHTQDIKPKVRFVNLRWYRLRFPMLTPYLRVQHHWRKISICRNSAPTLVSSRKLWKRQLFITIEKESKVMQTKCREYTQPRNLKTSRQRGWIRSTKIGPVLDVKTYPHEGRYCIDIMIESLYEDQTVSWVRIVNGINKYVTETSEEIPIETVLSQDRSLFWICLPITFLFVNWNG